MADKFYARFYRLLCKSELLALFIRRLLFEIIPETVKVDCAVVCVNPKDPVISGALALGIYEKDEIFFFNQFLKRGMTFIDVGANVGVYTALAAQKQCERILAFEPHSISFNYLQKTIGKNRKGSSIDAIKIALGAKKCERVIYINPNNCGDNRIYQDTMLLNSEIVKVETLDDCCKKYGIEKIDFLKIDVQGAEMEVILGGKKTLSKSKKCIILSEFWPEGLRKCGSDPEDYLNTLEDLGFKIMEIDGCHLKKFDRKILKYLIGKEYINLAGFGEEASIHFG
jgi:FkbM family methyltransferase